jgi:Protein of unknown function (DUF4199)
MNNSLKFGVFAGLGTIIYYLLFSMSDKKMIFTPSIFYSSMVIAIFFMYWCGKKVSDADAPFHQILKSVFTVWVIAELMYYIWYFRFFNADPMLAKLQTETAIESYQYLIAQSQDFAQTKSYHEAIDDLQKNPLVYTFKDSMLGLGRGLIGGFVISYIMTFILDRR